MSGFVTRNAWDLAEPHGSAFAAPVGRNEPQRRVHQVRGIIAVPAVTSS
jgi:hypothetical protein